MVAPTVAPLIRTSTIAQGMVETAWTVKETLQGIAANVAKTTTTRGLWMTCASRATVTQSVSNENLISSHQTGMLRFWKGKGTKAFVFSLVKGATLWGNCEFLLEHFKGIKAITGGRGGNCLHCLPEVSGLSSHPAACELIKNYLGLIEGDLLEWY